MTFSVAKIEK